MKKVLIALGASLVILSYMSPGQKVNVAPNNERDFSYLDLRVNEGDVKFVKCANQTDINRYLSLTLTKKDEETIHFIMNELKNTSQVTLARNYTMMNEKGDSIRHVHPLRYIGCILSNKKSKQALKYIYKTTTRYFCWKKFKNEYIQSLKRQDTQNNLKPYISGFAHHVKMDEKKIKKYVEGKNWEGLLVYLVKSS